MFARFLIAGLLLVTAGCAPKSTIPDTPVGRVLGEWLKAYNATDLAAIETQVSHAQRQNRR